MPFMHLKWLFLLHLFELMSQIKSGKLVRPTLTFFFEFNPILGPIFGFKWVGLALRIQKQVQLGQVDT
jgi:hypothetical protein